MSTKKLFLDVHDIGAGKVTAADVAEAHKKDLEVQGKYDTNFIKYWVDEKAGKVYCLVSAPDAEAVSHTHKEAHGLVPDKVHAVVEGEEAAPLGDKKLFLDIHKMGPGQVTAAAVADVHVKDLETQGKHDVNFINYWVDEAEGLVYCLAEAPSAEAMSATHKEAHGLVADEVFEVVQGE